jgi:uncharacterized protein YndB with AHSA1/START domain
MTKLRFSIVIHAPRKRVWEAMLGEESFRQWTEAFAPGSHYVGDWSTGSKMHFLAPDESGAERGMFSRVEINRPPEYVSVEHLGVIEGGVEDPSAAASRQFAGTHESYLLTEVDNATELRVEMDSPASYATMFEDTWPEALRKLKAIAES